MEWDNSGSTWSATIGATTFRVDEAGGRIIGYALGGEELLVDEDLVSGGDNANNFGSTFWLSPQAQWNADGWPPPTHIDSEDYSAEAAAEVLTLTGPAGTDSASEPTNDVSIVKVFTPDAAHNAIMVEYQMNNGGAAAAEWAPWQITRVPSEGITFFPSGEAVAGLKAELPMTKVGEYSFWQYNDADISDADGADHGDKFIGDGAQGWMAHVHEGILLLFQFADTAPADFATDDGEIAIYASASDPYIEIEPQGGVIAVPPNGSASWKVRWSLHTLPTEIAAEPGAALGDFAKELATELGPVTN